MNQQELIERIRECTTTQLKAVEAECKALVRQRRYSKGIEGAIMRLVEQAPGYKIRLSELKRRLRNDYTAQQVEEKVVFLETINGGYQVKLLEVDDEPTVGRARSLATEDKVVFGHYLEPRIENT